MDRFIEIMSEKKQLRYLYLKSNMDRFIELQEFRLNLTNEI